MADVKEYKFIGIYNMNSLVMRMFLLATES